MSALQRLGIELPDLKAMLQAEYSPDQEQTKETFGFKWSQRHTYESEAVRERTKSWLLERYCNRDPEQLNLWLQGDPKIILDAGCGSGLSATLLFGEHLKDHDYLGVDISDAVEIAREQFRLLGYPGEFLQTSLLDLPIPNDSVDLIFSEGVLHHTDSTEESIRYLATKLKPGGRFAFYVYAKKAILREFSDDHIRQYLQNLTHEEAWEALKSLTQLGITLGEVNLAIEIKEDIPFLGISRGKIDLQRFFYWNICKLFYHPDYTLEEMNHINFDWFRPLNCHRHTPEEVQAYCQNAGLVIEGLNVQESGITIVARKCAA